MPPSTRRRFLQTSSLALSLALAGCSGERERRRTTSAGGTATSTTTPLEPTTSEPTSSAPTTDEPTPNTPIPSAEREYRFGEWHVDEPWKLTVAEIELTTTFRTDDGETYEMPDDEQLLLVTTRVENAYGSRRHYSGAFDGLVDGRVYEDDMGFPHPDFERGVRTKDLAEVEHIRRWAPHALPVDPGETATSWLAWAVLREVERGDVRVGYDPEHDGSYPVRWYPT